MKGSSMSANGTQFLVNDPPGSGPEQLEVGPAATIPIRLSPVIIAIKGNDPVVLVRLKGGEAGGARAGLPFGPIETIGKIPIEPAMRRWAPEALGLSIGHVEQLSVFEDCAVRASRRGARNALTIGVLALARAAVEDKLPEGLAWRPWYDFLPWEDWRRGAPGVLTQRVIPELSKRNGPTTAGATKGDPEFAERVSLTFAMGGQRWNEDLVLERFEILADAGLLADEPGFEAASDPGGFGEAMVCGQRRVLAAAISRLRSLLRERPIAFELMEEQFTLLDLQRTVEAMLGPHLHKQNFRRHVEAARLVEPTGEINTHTGGRPAKLFRFRRQALLESSMLGLRARTRG